MSFFYCQSFEIAYFFFVSSFCGKMWGPSNFDKSTLTQKTVTNFLVNRLLGWVKTQKKDTQKTVNPKYGYNL